MPTTNIPTPPLSPFNSKSGKLGKSTVILSNNTRNLYYRAVIGLILNSLLLEVGNANLIKFPGMFGFTRQPGNRLMIL